ncbi:MAG: hypothetical protein M3Y81_11265 [Chloroflexota bacterium]|nr:hypothetical protein [Chloroflexota bacterium]
MSHDFEPCLSSSINVSIHEHWNDLTELKIELTTSRAIFDILKDKEDEHTKKLITAFNAVLPEHLFIEGISARVAYTEYNENWKEALLEVVEGKKALNQGKPFKDRPRFDWENLFFRSPVEIKIAQALDKTGVLFLPNCMARLGLPGSRENREADFLICYEGRWGIFEVNGETFHTSAAKDHDRGRLFKMHGIRIFEPYDAKRCINEPERVVKEFIEILRKNG